MKGLFIKDCELIWHNKKMFIIMLVVMFLAFQNYDGYSFLIGYNTMIFILLVLNTISLDEYYKCTSFLMTLPVRRETYVTEKYVLMIGFSFIGTALTTLICILLHREMALQLLLEALVIYLVMALLQLLMLPMQLKFGGEKGRIVLIGLLACVTVIATSLVKGLPQIFGMQGAFGELLKGMITWFLSLQKVLMVLVVGVFFAVCSAISYLISRKVVLRREF